MEFISGKESYTKHLRVHSFQEIDFIEYKTMSRSVQTGRYKLYNILFQQYQIYI